MYTGLNTVLTDAGVILRQYVSVDVMTHCTTLYLSFGAVSKSQNKLHFHWSYRMSIMHGT